MTRPQRRLAAVLAVAMWLVASGTAGAGEGDDPPEFHRDPGQGVPGTVVTVSGRGCSLDGKPAQRAGVFFGWDGGTSGGPTYSDSQTYPVATDGSWGGTFTVSADAPHGPYTMSAYCSADDMVWNLIDTDFEVLDPNARTTTTEAPPPPPTTQPPPPPPSTAAPDTTVSETAVAPSSTETSLAAATRPPRDDPPDGDGDAPGLPAVLAVVALLLAVGGAVAARRRQRAPAT